MSDDPTPAADDDLGRFCCQNVGCPDHGRRGTGNLTVCGLYGKRERIRLLYCRTCKYRFSERRGTPPFNARLATDKAASVLEHLADGCGQRQTARLAGVGRVTAARLGRLAGNWARAVHDELVAFPPDDAGAADGREVVVRRQEAGRVRPRRPGR